jgi:protein SDA1
VGEESRDQQAWENWLVESDSDSSSEPDWINVDSDGTDNLEISDSDSETADAEPVSTSSDQCGQLPAGVPSLATRKARNVPRVHTNFWLMPHRYLRQQILL